MDIEVVKEKLGWGFLVILVCALIFTLAMVITAAVIVIKEDANRLQNSAGENFVVISEDKASDFRMVKLKDKETGVYYMWVYLRSRPKEGQINVLYNKDGSILCDEVENGSK